MTGEEFGGLVRTVAAAGFGVIVSKGWIDASTATALAGAAGTIAVAIWSIRSKRAAKAA